MKLEKGIGYGLVVGKVESFEYLFRRFIGVERHRQKRTRKPGDAKMRTYRNNIQISHNSIGEGESKDDLDLERSDVSINRNLFHRV